MKRIALALALVATPATEAEVATVARPTWLCPSRAATLEVLDTLVGLGFASADRNRIWLLGNPERR